MIIIKKFLLWLGIIIVFLAVFLAYHLQTNAVVSVEEIIANDEPEQTKRAANNFIDIIKQTQTSYATRGAHAKGHACVKAYFNINEDISPQLQYGVFKTAGKQYKTWIRFSNGSSNIKKSADSEKDSRGMAIKLFDLDDSSHQTQAFLAHNSPAFFSVDLDDYNQLVESEDKINYFISGYNPFKWRLRELSHVVDTLAPPPYSPIWDDYFSNTAYKLGPHNIKFMMRSCADDLPTYDVLPDDPDFLQHTLSAELAEGEACMQFLVQLQDLTKQMPIEDPSVLWREGDSPFMPVATIIIPKQNFNSPQQQQFCENLSFSPWHSLEAHRPIGALNRVRKLVYQMSSDFRHAQNNQPVPTDLNWND